MSQTDLEFRMLDRADEMTCLVTLFQQIWGTVTPMVSTEILRAIAHSGGYVAGAYDNENLVGASFGFLARHEGRPALHSHVTGILPGVQHSGIGRAMKNHQRRWAAAHGLEWVTWTFDPLVRRNAWFNIGVLRAEVAEYLVDFYGPMTDAVNRENESDRLLVAWSTEADTGAPEAMAAVVTEAASYPPVDRERIIEVDTPTDIVRLRRTDPNEAAGWRRRIREQLGGPMAAGARVVGFTREGAYRLAVAR